MEEAILQHKKRVDDHEYLLKVLEENKEKKRQQEQALLDEKEHDKFLMREYARMLDENDRKKAKELADRADKI